MEASKWKVFMVFVQLMLLNEKVSSVESEKKFVVVKYSYDKSMTLEINESIEYTFIHDGIDNALSPDLPSRISVSSVSVTRTYPIFVSARQQKGISAWQLPVAVADKELSHLSRTLCPNRYFNINDDSFDNISNQPIVNIYTSSMQNITFNFMISLVGDFFLSSNFYRDVNISPSTPQVYFYSFGEDVAVQSKYKNQRVPIKVTSDEDKIQSSKNVIIRLDSSDNYCMLVSIQNASCPIFDTENDIMFEGFYETVSRRGGITIPRSRFPKGFFIVLVVKGSDEDCTGLSQNSNASHFSNFFDFDIQPFDYSNALFQNKNNERLKNVKLHIKPGISTGDYWLASMSAVIVITVIYVIFLSGIFYFKYAPPIEDDNDNDNVVQASIVPPTSPNNISSDNEVEENSLIKNTTNNETGNISTACLDDSVSRASSLRSLGKAENNGKIYLDMLCTRDAKHVKRQSDLYLWHLVTIAVFYGLPVIQLVINYQRVLNQSGNQDLCYYNFLCAHPVGLLSDFNHVFSNLGYVLLGALFIFFTWKKHRQYETVLTDPDCGIPRHHGLFYAMGTALMMEGVLSASYHVCPNHSNFQFDTSFMYIMAVLAMVKIYQTRHPDINARAHSTYTVLAAAIFICLFGVLYPNFYFWLFFTILHVGTCLVLTFQIYYLGQWKFNFCCCKSYKCGDVCKPVYRSRFILVVIANLCNWGLAFWGLWKHSKDFATHLLYVFLMNLALHLAFYIIMKVANKERPKIYTWVLLGVAMVTWGAALFFFFSASTSWALTPAESRTYNKECVLLKFYDYHDIWHLLSAMAMFFSFMLLLVLDDDIMHIPHSKIPVF